jgi:hypothetical protein
MRDMLTEAASARVIAELERHCDPLSHTILRGLEYLGTGDAATQSADAVARLAERGIGVTAKFADVAGARALGAWRATAGGRAGEYALFFEFEHPLGAGHSLALFVEPRRGGVVKHIGLMHPLSDLDRSEPFHPSAMDTIEIAEAAELVHELLNRSFGSSLAGSDDYRVVIAAARARALLQSSNSPS